MKIFYAVLVNSLVASVTNNFVFGWPVGTDAFAGAPENFESRFNKVHERTIS
jgi:hypothetical protein